MAVGLGLVGVVLLLLGAGCRAERLPRNRFVGIRTRATLRSDVAWKVGHTTAGTELVVLGAVSLGLALIQAITQVAGLGVVMLVAVVVGVLHAAWRADHAARSV